MWDIFLPKAALWASMAASAVGGGLVLGGALVGGPAAARARRLLGPVGLVGLLTLGTAGLAFPALASYGVFWALAALSPAGVALAAAGDRAPALGWLGRGLALLGPPACLAWMGEMSPLMGLVGGVHGAVGALALGLAAAAGGAARRGEDAARGGRWLLAMALAAPLLGGLGLRAAGAAAPLTLASLGAHWQDGAGVGLPVFALPRELEAENRPAGLVLPRALSLAGAWRADAPLVGAAAWPIEQRPPVVLMHLGLWAMIGGGAACLAGALAARRGPRPLGALRLAVAGAGLAELAGLLIVELGRGPYLLRPALTDGAAIAAAPPGLGLGVGLGGLALTALTLVWAARAAATPLEPTHAAQP